MMSEESCTALSVQKLAREYHGALLRFLRGRVGGSAEPADVAQEAYLRMLQYEGTRSIRSPYSMLLRVAANVAQDMHRAARVRQATQHRPLEDFELTADEPGPERRLSADEDLERVLAAIEELPPRRQQVFLLHREHHLSYAEIAERCGISVKMVEKHISSALTYCTTRVWGDATRPTS